MSSPADAPSDPSQPSALSLQDVYGRWYSGTPAITRGFVLCGIAGTILCIFGVSKYTMNSPFLTILHFQLWRIFLAGLVGRSVFGAVFSIFMIYQMGGRVENARGSMYLLLTSLIFTIAIQLVTVSLLTILGILFVPQLLLSASGGYWPICFVFAVQDCHNSMEPTRQLLCFPVQVPTLYYPWILGGIFFLLSGGTAFDILVGLALGTLSTKVSHFQVTDAFARRMEDKPFMHRIVSMPYFVTVDGIGYTSSGTWGNVAPDSSSGGLLGNAHPVSGSSSSLVVPFSGQGHRLDGGDPVVDHSTPSVFRSGDGQALADRYAAKN